MAQTDNRLQVGSPAPDFTLPDLKGTPYTLSEMVKHGPVLLFFFRGTWCPQCRAQMKRIVVQYANLTAGGAQIVGVAHQRAEIVADYFRLEPLNFPYLLDSASRVIDQYGLLRGFAPEALLLSRSGPQTTHPAAFLIDGKGVIRWLYVGRNPDDHPTMEQIKEQLQAIGLDQA